MSPTTRRTLVVVASTLLPSSALAHDLSDRYGPLLGALLHPLTALDHALALLAVGLLAGQQRPPGSPVTVAVLVTALLASVAAGMLGAIPDALTTALGRINLVSVPLLGALVAFGSPLPPAATAAIAGFAGLTHGSENGLDLGAPSASAVVGLGLAGVIAALPPALLVPRLPAGWPRVAVRVAGSWIAAIGLIMLALALRAG